MAVALVLVLAGISVVASALFFGFAEWPRGMRVLAPAFVIVSALEIAAHLAVAAALWTGRSWGRIAALVLAGVNLALLAPPTALALLVRGAGPSAFGPYSSEVALAATVGLATVAVGGNIALILLVGRSMRRAD